MNRNILLSIIFIILLLSATTTEAFDGNRKGFVLGGDLGWTHFQNPKNSNYTFTNELTNGFIIGYGLNNKNLIVTERTIFWSKSDGGYLMSQTSGITWFYYFNNDKKSIFTKLGYGLSNDALVFGSGYMLSNNIQFSLTYSYLTKIDDRNTLKFIISYVAF